MVSLIHTRADRLRHCLEEDILEGRLLPGARLDETRLAERFQVSRTPVREALKYLASSGLVVIRPHHGAIVARLTIKQLIDMFQVMAELEGLCARLAAQRISRVDRQRLLAAHKRCCLAAEEEGEEGFFRENNIFHEVIYAAARNSFLELQTRSLRKRLGPYRRYLTYMPGCMTNSVVEHQHIADAIFEGDEEVAHRLMRDHLDILASNLATLIAQIDEGHQVGMGMDDAGIGSDPQA